MEGRIVGSGARARYFVERKEVSKAEFDRLMEEARPKINVRKSGHGPGGNWSRPVISDALAVHPNQVQEAEASAKKKGVPTEFLADGRPVIRSKEHKRAYCKAYGFLRRDEFY